VSRLALGPTQPPVPWVTGAISLGVKQSGHEADHLPTSSSDVKNVWRYTSTPPLCLHCLVLTQPPIQWVPGALSLGVKRSGREADHSPPSSAKVKNAWSYTSTPQYIFMAWCLVKHRDNFTFTFTFRLGHVRTFIIFIGFGIVCCYLFIYLFIFEGVTISFQTNCLECELQMAQHSATRCSCIAIL
jgi:hypothetical protein